jgi:hypothetical protein
MPPTRSISRTVSVSPWDPSNSASMFARLAPAGRLSSLKFDSDCKLSISKNILWLGPWLRPAIRSSVADKPKPFAKEIRC